MIPGGKTGVWLIGGLGAAGVIFTFFVGLIPPDYFSNTVGYVASILFGTFVLAVPPLVFLKLKKPHWVVNQPGGKP